MTAAPAPDPDLQAAVAALLGAGARFVVIGGFAVIANDYVRATEDVDILVPSDPVNDLALDQALLALEATWQDGQPFRPGQLADRDHARLLTSAGILDLLRDGVAPLDFDSVSAHALTGDLGDGAFLIAGLESLVAFKRLAGRPRDHNDLLELEERHGPLPIVPIPGLDLPEAD
jgi:hypothetical protein